MDEKRTEVVSIRLTKAERAALLAWKQADESLGAVARRMLRYATSPPPLTQRNGITYTYPAVTTWAVGTNNLPSVTSWTAA